MAENSGACWKPEAVFTPHPTPPERTYIPPGWGEA